jgi:hypothetical protein
MSRSIKKVSVFKDGGHERKKIASRKVRRRNKVEVQQDKELFSRNTELTNKWDICDYKWYPKKKDKELYLKGKMK